MIACAVVPTRNHWKVLPHIVAALRAVGLPVFIIDDGSEPLATAAIAALHDPASGVHVHRLEVNQGKGAAVIEGFSRAVQAGFTHAVQVDADGQHDLHALHRLLARAAAHPDAVVTGKAVFDDTIGTNRRLGRWVTHVWVWIETLSLSITDSMCGFRVYPLAPVMAMLAEQAVGRRMDFDIEIIVRMHWRGTKVLMEPVRVTYPSGNTSNFDMLRDNLRITKMHTRLVFGMLRRLPALSWRRPPEPGQDGTHWTAMAERGAYWGLKFCTAAYRLLGRRGCMVVIAPVVVYFYAAGRSQRRASRQFLARALGRAPSRRDELRLFLSFAGRALDVFGGWTGGIPASAVVPTDLETLRRVAADPRGALLVVAHLGNVDLSRAVLDPATRARLTVLTHTRHAANYNRILAEFRPEAAVDLVQVTEMGPAFAIALKERVERGEWVVMAGDRTPVGGGGRVSRVPFMGWPAPFSQGPWILASLLECPVYLLFCLRRDDHWALTLEPFAERIELARSGRPAMLEALCTRYAARLEAYARTAPFQWFNFFDFWAHEALE